jgi:hypothetical protein
LRALRSSFGGASSAPLDAATGALTARRPRRTCAPLHQLFVLNRVSLQNLAVPLEAGGTVELNQQ